VLVLTDAPQPQSHYKVAPPYSSSPFSKLDLLNSRLRHATAYVDLADVTRQSVYDILYIVNEFGLESEPQTRMSEVDVSAARIATGKYTALMNPLESLGEFRLKEMPSTADGEEKLREDMEKKLAL
jgi:hypothetical protein